MLCPLLVVPLQLVVAAGGGTPAGTPGGAADVAELAAAIEQADRLEVRPGPPHENGLLYSSRDPRVIGSFASALTIRAPERPFFCACLGDPIVWFFRKGKEVAKVSIHHGISVHASKWGSHALIADREKLFAWFDARGMPGPRREYEEDEKEAKKSAAAKERWRAAMPEALAPVWDEVSRQLIPEVGPLRAPLAAALPEPRERILALLAWFGSGMGPWTGFPAYEQAAENMLLEFTTTELVDAVQSTKLTEAQTEGLARLFAGWEFGRKRPQDRADLPRALKQALLKHTLKSTDKDKRSRAQRAFGSK